MANDPWTQLPPLKSETENKPEPLARTNKTENSKKVVLVKKVIVIDPGHGDGKWADPGALGIDDKPPHEKEHALTLSKAIGSGLERLGYIVKYTRIADVVTKKEDRLKWRVKFANTTNADCFISVHLNSMDAKINYFMVAHGPKKPKGKKMADCISASVKQPGFSKSTTEEHDYQVLKVTAESAVLIEAGNVKNTNNSKIITDAAFIQQIIDGISKGISN